MNNSYTFTCEFYASGIWAGLEKKDSEAVKRSWANWLQH